MKRPTIETIIIICHKIYVYITGLKIIAVSTVAKGIQTIYMTYLDLILKSIKGSKQKTAKKDYEYGPRSSDTL